jgi:PAS domain S-box-containing protein
VGQRTGMQGAGSSSKSACMKSDAKTKIKTKARKQRKNLEKYETLVNNLSVGVYRNTPGPEGHFLEANPAMVSMFEADSLRELMRHNVSDLYQNPLKRASFIKKLTRYGTVKNEELNLVTLKGKKIIASVTAVRKKTKEGTVYFDGIIEDITRRKKTEEALKQIRGDLEIRILTRTNELKDQITALESARRAMFNVLEDLTVEKTKAENSAYDLRKFKLALDNTSDHVTITDVEGIVVYANAAVEKITGYAPEDALGKKAGALWKLPMPIEFYQNLWNTIKNQKKTFLGEIQNRNKNGHVYSASINISPVLDEDGDILFFVGIERDITKEKEVDEAKGEFIALASHQMRTPITIINWYTEMLLSGDAGVLNPKQIDYFNQVHAASQRMNAIIKSFLHILSLETGTLQVNPIPVDLVATLRAILGELKFNIEKKRLRIVEHYQESLPALKVDAEVVQVVLENIVSNAVKYSPENGEISVSATRASAGDVIAGKTIASNSLVIGVSDGGIGIAANDVDKIFSKFFRSESAKKWDPNGNGLGLYMTNKMVEIIGGLVWFTSQEGKGTQFYVLLPLEVKKQDE